MFQSGKSDPGLHSSWICQNRKGVWMLDNAKWHIVFSLMIINLTHLEGVPKRLSCYRDVYIGSIIPALLHLFIGLHESVVGAVNENIFISMLTNLLSWLFIFRCHVICMTKWVFGMNNESSEEKTHLPSEHRLSLSFKVKIILFGISFWSKVLHRAHVSFLTSLHCPGFIDQLGFLRYLEFRWQMSEETLELSFSASF